MGLLRTAATGALSGFLATVPMTAVMVIGQRATGYGRLPPEALVGEAIDEASSDPDFTTDDIQALADDLDEPEVEVIWRGAHLAAGAAFGAIYAVVFRPLTRILPASVSGFLFGLIVWRVSYQSVAPALELLPPADSDDEDRQRTNVVAHAVYGTTLGLLLNRLR